MILLLHLNSFQLPILIFVEKSTKETVSAVEEKHVEDLIPEEKAEEKTKNKGQKKKKKKKKNRRHQQRDEDDEENEKSDRANEDEVDVEIEYIQEEIKYDEKNPFYRQFAKIFEAFKMNSHGALSS